MTHVYLGLGSNLGDRQAAIQHALDELGQRVGCVWIASRLYETEPWGVVEQPRFLNATCALCTRLAPEVLLDALKQLERDLGRMPTIRYGPRIIDLDILLYGDLVLNLPHLTIPHAGMLERSSVLAPLAEIAPEVIHPVTGRTVRWHLEALGPLVGVALYPPGLSNKGEGSSLSD